VLFVKSGAKVQLFFLYANIFRTKITRKKSRWKIKPVERSYIAMLVNSYFSFVYLLFMHYLRPVFTTK